MISSYKKQNRISDFRVETYQPAKRYHLDYIQRYQLEQNKYGKIEKIGKRKVKIREERRKKTSNWMSSMYGDPYEIRTRDAAVKGRSLNRLTNGPSILF